MADALLESLKCAICLDYATDAVETKCCEQVYCEKCLTGITNRKCPSCNNENLAYSQSKTLRRQIAYLPADCPNGCEQRTTRGELKRHLEICPNTEYVCPIETCRDTEKFSGKENKYADHLMSVHRRHVFAEVAKSAEKEQCKFPECKALVAKSLMSEHIWTVHDKVIASIGMGLKTEECKFPQCKALVTNSLMSEHIWTSHANDIASIGKVQCPFEKCISRGKQLMSGELMLNHLAETHQKILCNKMKNGWFLSYTEKSLTKNQQGNLVNMAHNGKFYCGQPNSVWALNSVPVYSGRTVVKYEPKYECNKVCNVNAVEGVNCDACMKLDVMFRNLPYGYLVNGKGKVCVPKPCYHELKDRGTTAFDRQGKRSILCHLNACGSSPLFYCGDCKDGKGACDACGKIAELMSQDWTHDPTKKSYGFVWQAE